MAFAPVVLTAEEDQDAGDGYGDGNGAGYGYSYGDGNGDGYGDGYGNGYGDGYGYGYGNGNGYGYGDGYGAGNGDGYGYGDGYGDGNGYGYGDGYGYGYGDGYGNGNGNGSLAAYLSHPLVVAFAREERVTLAFWRSDARGQSANGGRRMVAAAPGLVQEVEGPLRLCSGRALHASVAPGEWSGVRWWVVALLGEIERDGSKAGALRRLIVEEVV